MTSSLMGLFQKKRFIDFMKKLQTWKARCAFFGRNLHSMMPLDPTHVRFKRTCVGSNGIPLGCPLLLPVDTVNCVTTLKVDVKTTWGKQGADGIYALDSKKPMSIIYSEAGLDENTQDFVGHAIALHRDESYKTRSCAETFSRIVLYAESVARYGTSPYLYPLYGLGELPQGTIPVSFRQTNCVVVFKDVIRSQCPTFAGLKLLASKSACVCNCAARLGNAPAPIPIPILIVNVVATLFGLLSLRPSTTAYDST
jgi:hypothetical protein